jgi:lipopolysaccharide transport system permease protein
MKIENSIVEVIYSPISPLRKPFQFLLGMFSDLLSSRELAKRLFIRNISAMYRQSILGYVWAFLPPIATTMVWVFLNSSKIVQVQTVDIPYPVYVMVGTLLWQVFVDALNSPLKLMASSKAMLVKINFPREALILAGIYEVLFNFTIRLILFVGILLLYHVALPISAILAPLGILSIMTFGLMLGVLLIPIGALYQDIERGVLIITSFWFYLTPIVYSAPKNFPANVVATYNPLSPLIISTRDWITTGFSSDNTSFIIISLSAVVLLFFGWVLYRIAMPHVIARIGA